MSENDNKSKAVAVRGGWTDHEVLVYIFCAMESANWTPDFATAPVPEGRNVSACRQKINRIKAALKSDIEALKAGEAIPEPASTAAATTPAKKPATPRKGKAKTVEEDAPKTSEAIAGPKSTTANASPTKKPATPRKSKAKTDEEDASKDVEATVGLGSTTATASPTKKPATPRKRKTKTDENNADDKITPKKARGRPKKQPVIPEVEVESDNIVVKVDNEDNSEDEI